ncbi:hypothetical protein ABZ383_26410 [Streptomyces sp. NPDC005900]|uniref:hypothetical protein n=1 Tax=Streptomyces sp. NPDC005900 TaxID=3154569 RepID=UPI0033F06B5F
MSLYDLPPICRAFADSAYDSGCRISPGHCNATGTRRVIAYDLATPQLAALHTEVTCEAHAHALASHWQRRGVRRPGKTKRHTVLSLITDYQRSLVGTYPHALAPALPGMPQPDRYIPAGEYRRRPPVEVSAVTVISVASDPGPRSARLDITPTDSSGLGKTRRQMALTLAHSYRCQVYAGMSLKGPWSDPLNLQAFGDEDNVKALREVLPRTLAACEAEARGALTGYRAWLRRHYNDGLTAGERRSACTTWRREFQSAFITRWTDLLGGATGTRLAQAPRVDADDYPASQAAEHAAHELWLTMRQLDPRAPAAALVTQPPQPREARHHGRRGPYLRPPATQDRDPGHQLTLWQPPTTHQPRLTPRTAPQPTPQPSGRPLLEVLTGAP